MTNPVTQKLIEQINDHSLHKFVEAFDVLEVLIIQIFKSKSITKQDEKVYRKAKKQMRKYYRKFQPALTAYWTQTTINDQLLTEDPFIALVSHGTATDFLDNWHMMQTIPPARQALNEWLLDKTQKDNAID